MTVNEMIKVLSKYNPDTPILVEDVEGNEYEPNPILQCRPIFISKGDEEIELPGIDTVYL